MLNFLLALLPDFKRYSHQVSNGSMTLEEYQKKMREIYGDERSFTFEEFKEMYNSGDFEFRNFTLEQFEFYEGGAYGCGWLTATMQNPDDLVKYKEWLSTVQ